ncbi:MAG: leucine-rich repeat domain-containing protein [Veillonellaceae bacterium]|nr:leucine-rich repeat domain-containing protein [Veillonellaceae bacterium]
MHEDLNEKDQEFLISLKKTLFNDSVDWTSPQKLFVTSTKKGRIIHLTWTHWGLPVNVKNWQDVYHDAMKANLLEKVPDSIENLEEIERIELDCNKISELPLTFANLNKLRFLSISYNKLKEIPKEIFKLRNLEYLNLASNHLCEIPDEITQLNKLKVLLIGDNNIKKCPDSFIRFEKLQVLDIRDWQCVPYDIEKIKSLKRIYVNKELLPFITSNSNIEIKCGKEPIIKLILKIIT